MKTPNYLLLFVFVLMIVAIRVSIAEPQGVGAKPKIKLAVIELKSLGVDSNMGVLLTEKLRNDLFAIKTVEVLNREDMKHVLDERDMAESECESETCVMQLGRLAGVSKMITGSVGKLGNSMTITIKCINMQTGANEKIASKTLDCKKGLFGGSECEDKKLFKNMTELANEIVVGLE